MPGMFWSGKGCFWLNGKTTAAENTPFLRANIPVARSAGAGSSPAGERGRLRTVKPMPALRARPLRSYVSASLVSERERVRRQPLPPADALSRQIAQNLLFWGYFSVIMGMDFTDRRLLYESS